MNDWIPIEEKLPSKVGEYWCKNEFSEFPCFYVRSLNGQKVWLKVSEDLIITHWKIKK